VSFGGARPRLVRSKPVPIALVVIVSAPYT
jgi:hypothetical protein